MKGLVTNKMFTTAGPSITGHIAHPSGNFLPCTTIVLPVGVAGDAPQKANLP
jgi:hypothetical protein